MDPNSTHQLWNRLTFTVTVPFREHHADPRFFAAVKLELSKKLRALFGSVAQARVRYQIQPTATAHTTERWIVDVRYEATDKPVFDPGYRSAIEREMREWFVNGFGSATVVRMQSRIEAGDMQDGRPREQLLIVPPVRLVGEIHG